MMRVHGNVSNVEDGSVAVSAPVGKKGSLCSVCNRCFPNARALALHARVHSGADSDALTTAAPVSKTGCRCSICNASFANNAYLSKHVQQKHTSVVGDNVAITEGTSGTTTLQTSRETFPCTVCKKMFYTGKALQLHVSRLHVEEVLSLIHI